MSEWENLVREQVEKHINLPESEQQKIRKLEIIAYLAEGKCEDAWTGKYKIISGYKAFCYMTDKDDFTFRVNPSAGISGGITNPAVTPKEALAWIVQECILSWVDGYSPKFDFDPKNGVEIFVSPSHYCVLDLLKERYSNIVDKRNEEQKL